VARPMSRAAIIAAGIIAVILLIAITEMAWQ
jgi:FlaG/FlaF family flagellin (archaellin)